MEQEIKRIIKTSLNSLKLDITHSNFKNTKLLEHIGIELGIEKLEFIFQDEQLLANIINSSAITPPTYVYNFIAELVKTDNNKSIFDPWLTISSPLLFLQAENLAGTCISTDECGIIKALIKDQGQNFKIGNPISELSNTKEKFDVVLSFSPFGLTTQRFNGTKSNLDFDMALLLECSQLIDTNGQIIFLVSNSFLRKNRGKDTLKKAGLFIDAVFEIPSGELSPITSIPSNLIIVSKNIKEKTFVAEISQNTKTNSIILNNFKNKHTGKAISLGCFVDLCEFKSLSALISNKEMTEMGEKIGYPPISLCEISDRINILINENRDDIEHLINSIYLPKVGNFPVVSSLSEMKGKPNKYYQIQLDETRASAIYVANYFNTPIGKKLRESLEEGTVMRQIFRKQLDNCVLYIPDLNTQSELLEVDSKIQQYTIKLEELKRNLWKDPISHKEITKELKTFNQEVNLENWIDKLPFPISSILWQYYATIDHRKKLEHLFHFFEAFSEFLSMLMLSALVQDKEFYNSESHNWIDTDEKYQDWYLIATFGNWNVLTSKLSKAIRKYLNDEGKKDHCKKLFSNPSDAFLSMITSKEIVHILKEVGNLRNKWKGHTGVTSDEENNQRVRTLENHLYKLRKYIADAFDDIVVISPKNGNFEDGIFNFDAKKLIGARISFKEESIESLIPLDKNKLYLSRTHDNKPLPLLPFIKYIEDSKAIYFYSRIEKEYVRWVSYHYEKVPDRADSLENSLQEAFDYLKNMK